jgi:mannitol 2-dehydrogenase
VQVLSYDRRALTSGIVHIGVGGFHRAHQAVILDDLLHHPGSKSFGICGVGLLGQDRAMAEALSAQDNYYTLVTRSAEHDHARVIGSIIQYLHAPADPEAVIERMANEETKIVSLTITEAGYCENKATKVLDPSHPDIVHDLEHPENPHGVYGYLAVALNRRRMRGQPPFTVMSCDNLLSNGDICRRMTLAFLEMQNPTLGNWVAAHGAFPNCMVDRITPATTDEHRALVREKFGIDDRWPVIAEEFKQWVIEDHFVQGRPAWENAGAQIVADVHPYEKMKIRLLNGGHQAMCYIGMLLGYRSATEAMADEQIRTLVRRYMDQEVTPLLSPVPGIDLAEYKVTLLSRFANPAINDQLGRIGTDGSARIAEFVLPTVRDQIKRGGPTRIAAFIVAAWMRYLSGRDDTGSELPFSDAQGTSLQETARQGGADASVLLSIHSVFGSDLPKSPIFADEVRRFLRGFYEYGARATLSHFIESLQRENVS